MNVRFVADWITGLDDDEEQVFSKSVHPDFESACLAAIAGSKSADAIEWVCVREQHQDPKTLQWFTAKRWSGDYDSLEGGDL